MSSRRLSSEAELERLQDEVFGYFLRETNPVSGLVIDKTAAIGLGSIATSGLAVGTYPLAVEHGCMPRAAAVEGILTTLKSWHPVRRATLILYEHCVHMTENQTAFGRLRA
jgi:hypothetical protein